MTYTDEDKHVWLVMIIRIMC